MTDQPSGAPEPAATTPSSDAVEPPRRSPADPEMGGENFVRSAALAAPLDSGANEAAARDRMQTGAGDQTGSANGKAPPKKESLAATLLSLLIKSIICAVLLWLFVFQISFVKGESMEPTFHEGDRLVIDKLTFWFSDVQRNDVVIFDHVRTVFDAHAADGETDRERHEDYIKRVIGLPGDLVRIQRGVVYVNGVAQTEPWLKHTTGSQLQFYPLAQDRLDGTLEVDSSGMDAVRVKPGFVFVMGDNRGHSTDSRVIGQVKISLIRGKVRIRMLPTDRFRWFDGGE